MYPNPGRITRFITPPSPDKSTGSSSGREPPRQPEPVEDCREVVVKEEKGELMGVWAGGRRGRRDEDVAGGQKAWTGVGGKRRRRRRRARPGRWRRMKAKGRARMSNGGSKDMGCCLLRGPGPGMSLLVMTRSLSGETGG